MSSPKLTIAYAGLLADYESCKERPVQSFPLSWLRSFRNQNIRAETRSGKFLVEAIKLLSEKRPTLSKELSIQLWGKIAKGNKNLVKEYNLENIVEISDKLPHDKSRDQLSKADLLFLPLESEKSGQRPLNIPGKLYDYLEFEKPILALCGESDCKDIIEKSGLGIFAKPDSPEDIAKVLEGLIENRESLSETYKPNRDWIKKNYSAKELTKQLATIVNRLAE